MRRFVAIAATVLATSGAIASSAIAARNPAGTGQPGTASTNPNHASCGSPGSTSMPPGFSTAGFANAASHYAGSPGTPSAANGNTAHAISEYDIACYQQTQNGH